MRDSCSGRGGSHGDHLDSEVTKARGLTRAGAGAAGVGASRAEALADDDLGSPVVRRRWSAMALTLLTSCGWGAAAKGPPGYAAPSSSPVAHAQDGQLAAAPPGMEMEERAPAMPGERPGLGTSWGERVAAPVSFAPFVRATAQPQAELALHYNDAAGVQAHAAMLGVAPGPVELVSDDHALSVMLVDDAWRPLPGLAASGRTLVMGEDGDRYRIVVRNETPVRFEVVASVDGLDVIDGQPADPSRRGYLVGPYGLLTIDGFRTSDEAIAAFRFGKVSESYAARTSGDRDVGVIGLAIFGERGAVWSPSPMQAPPPVQMPSPWELHLRDSAEPFPARGYATPPR